jgi:hypothetical protein
MIHAEIRSDSKQPGWKTSGGVESMETSEGPNEGFLGQILRLFPIADHPPDQAQDLAPVLFQKLLVGALVVRQAPPDQIRIVIPLL